MNKFIKEQLNKCNTKLPDWNDNTKVMVISSKLMQSVPDLSGTLHISIANYIINEPPNFTLSSNWNGGTKPPENEMMVEIVDTLGKMYKVSGHGVNNSVYWEGWLPRKGFSVIE